MHQAQVHALDLDVLWWEMRQVVEHVLDELLFGMGHQPLVVPAYFLQRGREDAAGARLAHGTEVARHQEGIVGHAGWQPLKEAIVQNGGPCLALASQVGAPE
jgi:hypothetical protein